MEKILLRSVVWCEYRDSQSGFLLYPLLSVTAPGVQYVCVAVILSEVFSCCHDDGNEGICDDVRTSSSDPFDFARDIYLTQHPRCGFRL